MTDFKETVDFKKLAELIAPEKHLCIKCKQHLANTGIICDNCITKITNLIAEFGLTKKEEEKEKEKKEPPTTLLKIDNS
jgi:predicted amidophosphoribosyltransferase